jgi:hypothetical protein
MGVAPVAAVGPATVPAVPVFTPAIASTASASGAVRAGAASPAAAPAPVEGGYYLVSGPAFPAGVERTRLEEDLMKAALLIGILDEDDEKQRNPFLDLVIAAAVLKMYQQISALGTTSAVGFIGDGAGGAVGISVSVRA